MYGLEALIGNTAWINKLENVQNKIARVGFGGKTLHSCRDLEGENGGGHLSMRE